MIGYILKGVVKVLDTCLLKRHDLMLLRISALLACMANVSQAYAYLDPGTGSIILQLLFGGIAGAAAVAHLYWNRIKQTIKRVRGSEVDQDSEGNNDETPS